jgi:hypothetical protein
VDAVQNKRVLKLQTILPCIGMAVALWSPVLYGQMAPNSTDSHPRFSKEPDSAQIVTTDIANFWFAYDRVADNPAEVFQKYYIDKGTVGLRDFVQLRIESARQLADCVMQHSRYYSSTRESTARISSFTPRIRESFHRLKDLYPDAVFPNVYFVIGRMSSAGTFSDNGLLIGAEMYGRTSDMPVSELSEWDRQVLKPVDDLPGVVAHELIHFEQKERDPQNLLGAAVNEGSADFVGEMISGLNTNGPLHKYGHDHERQLWEEFRQDMLGADGSKWMYNGNTVKDRPADLAYYVGYKICQAYYDRSLDKKKAIREIIEVQDYEQFLQKSGYAEKFLAAGATAR